jgi:hypothetical protein
MKVLRSHRRRRRAWLRRHVRVLSSAETVRCAADGRGDDSRDVLRPREHY